ncbi:MAG TPA: radical SAM protein [Tepidisphaeraceae bacterium]|nr:radical SAM protein [Tepidisphaeraceae bacterium]
MTSNSRLRIALISPKGPLYRHRGGIFGRSLRYKPLTLTTLGALVPPELNAEVTLIDEGIADVPESLDVDLVGMTVITGTAPRAYELSKRFRDQGITTILGGPHVTLVPNDAQPHADSIVVGYAEDTWPQLLRDFVAAKLNPRYDQAPGLDLAGRPFAKRDLLPANRFLTDNVFEATRGCVHDCDFCVVPSAWGRKPLQRPTDEVVAELSEHLAKRRSRKLIFVDLNLIADRVYATELFSALVPLKVKWYGLATTLIGRDDALLALAARSGCQGLLIGFESISPDNLKLSRKGFNHPDDYAALVAKLHAHGIAVQGCFTFGMDEDDAGIFERTARFAIDAKIDLPRFAVVTPFPGTPLHRRLETENRILTRDWSLYDGQHVVFRPKRMTVEQLQLGTERAWKLAYGWRAITTRLRHSPAPLHVRMITNLGYRFYARNLHRFYNCDWIIDARSDGASSEPVVPITVAGAAVS